jgi:hypothetical protein
MPNQNDPNKPQPEPGKGTGPGKPLKGPRRDGDDKPPQTISAVALGGIIASTAVASRAD